MKIRVDFPLGGKLYIEWKPMDQGRFVAICWLIGIFLVGSGVLRFFGMLT